MRVLLLNPANPWMNAVTEALERAGYLSICLFPYRTQGTLARIGPRLPVLGRRIAVDLNRRRVLTTVPDDRLAQPARGWEVARALVERARRTGAPAPAAFEQWLIDRRNRAMSQAARTYLGAVDVVLASETLALEAYEEAGRRSVLRVLEMAIAHHRFSRRLLQEEAALRPDLASTLLRKDPSRAEAWRRDRECALADGILVASRFVAESCVAEGIPAEKILKAPYGVDAARFRPGEFIERPQPFRVVFVGGIGQRKGVGYLFDAYRAFRKPDTELTLVGAPVGDRSALEPYRDLYRHIPFAPNWELPHIYASSAVFVLPSVLEGFGLVVLEAMASGLPVIVTPCGPDEVVQDGINGYVTPFRDAAAIADRLERLYRSPDLRRRMGEAARVRALEFTWERYGSEVVRLLEERLALHRARGAGRGV